MSPLTISRQRGQPGHIRDDSVPELRPTFRRGVVIGIVSGNTIDPRLRDQLLILRRRKDWVRISDVQREEVPDRVLDSREERTSRTTVAKRQAGPPWGGPTWPCSVPAEPGPGGSGGRGQGTRPAARAAATPTSDLGYIACLFRKRIQWQVTSSCSGPAGVLPAGLSL